MEVLPAFRPHSAGAREERDAEPVRAEDDPRLCRVNTSAHHPGENKQRFRLVYISTLIQ